MTDIPKCVLCGEPMPQGEEMFKYHGYSGPCPKPPAQRQSPMNDKEDAARYRHLVSKAFWRGANCIALYEEFVASGRETAGVGTPAEKKAFMDASIDATLKALEGSKWPTDR